MKRIISVILTLAMFTSAVTISAVATDDGIADGRYAPSAGINVPADKLVQTLNSDCVDSQGVYYTLNEISLTATVGMNTYADSASAVTEGMAEKIVIPETVVFNDVSYTVTNIGRNAFDGSDICSIYIPATCDVIGEFAFAGCTKLDYVYFGGTEIKGFAFWGCSALSEAYISNAFSIGGGAFWNCTSLRNVRIEAKTIMEKAFEGCTNIEYYVIGNFFAPTVAAGALGENPLIFIDPVAEENFKDFPYQVSTFTLDFLDVEDVYGKGGDTVQVSVVATVGLSSDSFDMTVNLADGLTLVDISGEYCGAEVTANGNVLTVTSSNYSAGAIVVLNVKIDPLAEGYMPISVFADGMNCIGGSVTVCDHSNTKTVTVKSASCTEAGTENTVCAACGDVISTNEVAAKNHSYKDFVITPTCVDNGYTRHICEYCFNSYNDAETPSLGHTWGEPDVKVEVSETKDGVVDYTCLTCGTVERVTIPKIIYGDADDNGAVNTMDAVCILKHIAKHEVKKFNEVYADLNADKNINTLDVILLLKYIANWPVTLGPQ